MNEINVPGMTDEQFVDKYVEVATTQSIEAADGWASGLFEDGKAPVDVVAKFAPIILPKLVEAGIFPAEAAPQAEQEAPTEAVEEAASEPAVATEEASEE